MYGIWRLFWFPLQIHGSSHPGVAPTPVALEKLCPCMARANPNPNPNPNPNLNPNTNPNPNPNSNLNPNF